MITRELDRDTRARGVGTIMIADVVDGVETDLEVLVISIADRVTARFQAKRTALPAALQDALYRGVLAGVRDALARLRAESGLPQELPPDLLELARICVHARCELPALADAWIVGQEAFWDRFGDVAERTLDEGALCWDAIKAARTSLSGYAARMSELFRAACEMELAPANGVDEDSRLRAVSRALEGHWVEPAELGYDLTNHHIAAVADSPASLHAMARSADRQLLLVKAPGGGTWGWLGGPDEIADGDLDALIAGPGSGDGHVAVGEPATGIAGFAASHRQALEARKIARATNQHAVRFADLRLLIAVLRDDELANGFIERELGELDDPSERMRELRDTLRAYLEHGQSVSATAALRRRDRKTIERQLRSAERLIHHRVSDRSDEVLVALRAAEILRNGTDVVSAA